MILWELFLGFLRVGCFAFGGAYSAIPLIREIVLSYGWLTEDALAGMIAISESTPGPIMVNLATYVGMEQAGVPGVVIATFAVMMPSLVIILLVMAAFRALVKHPLFQSMLSFVKPCIAGIILAAGTYMMLKNTLYMDSERGMDVRSVLYAQTKSLKTPAAQEFWFSPCFPTGFVQILCVNRQTAILIESRLSDEHQFL